MSDRSRVSSFEDLRVFRCSTELVLKIYKITQQGPFQRDLSLREQIRKASISIASNIAEGFERGSNADLIRFLYISKGSCAEVKAQLILAKGLSYIDETTFGELAETCRALSSMIWKFISYLKHSSFKGPKQTV